MPPSRATRGPYHRSQERSTDDFESALGKNTALRSVPDLKGRPRLFGQHLPQSELIGLIHGALSVQTSSHELGNVAVLGDRLPDHRQLSHRRVVLGALQRSGILSNLQANKDQRYEHTNRSNDLREVGYLLERHNDLALPANLHGGRVRSQWLSVHFLADGRLTAFLELRAAIQRQLEPNKASPKCRWTCGQGCKILTYR